MRVVLDTNVHISALISASGPARLVTLWRHGQFEVITSEAQLDELARATGYPKIRERLHPALAVRLINELRGLALIVQEVPRVDVSPDPYDNYLLAAAAAGKANYLVTGDKRDLLTLKEYLGIRIVGVRDFLGTLDK